MTADGNMQTQITELSQAVTILLEQRRTWLERRKRLILDCWKTPLGWLFCDNAWRGTKLGKLSDPPPGGVIFYSVFPNGDITSSPFPFEGAGAEDPQETIGKIEINFSDNSPTWRNIVK